jgi:hypothetical protein
VPRRSGHQRGPRIPASQPPGNQDPGRPVGHGRKDHRTSHGTNLIPERQTLRFKEERFHPWTKAHLLYLDVLYRYAPPASTITTKYVIVLCARVSSVTSRRGYLS